MEVFKIPIECSWDKQADDLRRVRSHRPCKQRSRRYVIQFSGAFHPGTSNPRAWVGGNGEALY